MEPERRAPHERVLAPGRATAEALERELRRWQAIVASSLDPLVAIDPRGTVLVASDSVERVFGWKPAELIGRNINVLMPEPHRSAHDGYLSDYRRTGVTHILGRTREFEVVRRDGSRLTCELSVSRADLPGGEVVYSGSFRDVTDRRRAEDLLAESERRFHAVFDGAFQYLGLLEPDGRILEANATSLEAVGARRADVVGQPFWEAPWWSARSGDVQRVREAVQRASAGEFVRFEYEVRTKSGEIREVDFSVKPVRGADGRVALLIPEGRDVTELKRAQRAETDMLRRLATVGEQAAVLAHEIKNPITAVNVALRAVAERLGTEQRAVLEDLVARMQRLEQLMHGTLSFAKPIDLRRETIDTRAFLEGVVARLRLRIVRAGAHLSVDVMPEAARFSADPHRLEEVLANLVINALEARSRAVRIAVHAGPLGRTGVRLTVDDDGPGIPAEHRARLFVPFATTKHTGTGLGLAISRRIVEAHGGTLEARESPLGGARFEIDLPGARER
jgi:PAS domain S-box-containing protein